MSGRKAPRKVTRKEPLLADVMTYVRKYVVVTDEQLMVIGLWIIHTHCFDEFEQTPYLSITSPEPQCGKSRLLEVMELVCRKALTMVIPSEAVLYRTVHLKAPTLLLDEIDTIFNPRSQDKYEGHRAMLNSGHRKSAVVPRCTQGGADLINFRVFCPKAIAGIGTLPKTVADRSIPIRMKRRSKDEEVDRFYYRDAKADADALEQRIAAWVDKHKEGFGDVHPPMPVELSDRMQDGCEPLVVIADALGYSAEARAALVIVLNPEERMDSEDTMRVRLLRDLKAVFGSHEMPRALTTERILGDLMLMSESPWITYFGHGLDARDLATLLGHYGVRPTTIRPAGRRNGSGPEPPKPAKGYKRDDLHDAWERYL